MYCLIGFYLGGLVVYFCNKYNDMVANKENYIEEVLFCAVFWPFCLIWESTFNEY